MDTGIQNLKLSRDEDGIKLTADVSPAVHQRILEKIAERIRKIYVPLPVCGGDYSTEEGWGWAAFEGYCCGVENGKMEMNISVSWHEDETDDWLRVLPALKEMVG